VFRAFRAKFHCDLRRLWFIPKYYFAYSYNANYDLKTYCESMKLHNILPNGVSRNYKKYVTHKTFLR